MLQVHIETNTIIGYYTSLQPDCRQATEEEALAYNLKTAKEEKLRELRAYVLEQKTRPFQKLRAPEVTLDDRGFPIVGEPVLFKFYNTNLPNSAIKATDVVNSVGLDYLEVINNILQQLLQLNLDTAELPPIMLSEAELQAILNSESLTFEAKIIQACQAATQAAVKSVGTLLKNTVQHIYQEGLSKGISLYPCDLIRETLQPDGTKVQTEESGIVNIFPIVFALKKHLATREQVENSLLSVITRQIEACTTPEEVRAISWI